MAVSGGNIGDDFAAFPKVKGAQVPTGLHRACMSCPDAFNIHVVCVLFMLFTVSLTLHILYNFLWKQHETIF